MSQARRCGAFALLLCVLVLAATPAARAEPSFSIKRISTQLEHGVYYLDADMHLELNERARQALKNGVALTFVIDIHVLHRRLWLWNSVDANLAERFKLRYFPLTEHYRIENLNSGAREGYSTLEGALAAISQIRHLPVIDASLLAAGTTYYLAMRVVLDTKQLPGPLKVMANVVPGWQLASDWHEERLTP
jgi:hypothetical protein